jgi:hypothetical protein
MTKELFPGFLADASQYERAEGYWRDLWRGLLTQVGQADQWRSPWLTSEHDGNPIFSAICSGRRLGVQVIQHVAESPEEIDLDWWIDWFGEESDPDSVRKLVISCVLTDRTAPLIAGYLRQWVRTGQVSATEPPPSTPEPARHPGKP